MNTEQNIRIEMWNRKLLGNTKYNLVKLVLAVSTSPYLYISKYLTIK